MTDYEHHEYDVLIIGAGGAGLRAAIEAKQRGLSVGIVTKSLLGKAHTVMAEGGMAAAMGNVYPEDNWMVHFRDTMRGGKYLNNYRMAELHAKESPERVWELEQWGALFDRTKDGKILQRDFGGHRYARLAHVGDRTGLELIRTLQQKVVSMGTDVYMECKVLKLVARRRRPSRGLCRLLATERRLRDLRRQIGDPRHGWGRQVLEVHFELLGGDRRRSRDGPVGRRGTDRHGMHPVPPHGHGLALKRARPARDRGRARRRGRPAQLRRQALHVQLRRGHVSRRDGRIRGGSGQVVRRPLRGPSTAELLPRDEVARAINAEVKAGRGSPHGGVYLDIASRRSAEFIRRRLPSMYHQFMELAGVDITTDSMEIGPTCHYIMGGVKVDAETAATLAPGLFAAGEVAGGMHGANRLGGNSLSDLVVFGKRAGMGAADYVESGQAATTLDMGEVEDAVKEALAPFDRTTGENPYDIQRDLQEMMQVNVGIIRTQSELEFAATELDKFTERVKNIAVKGGRAYNPGWNLTTDLPAMLTVCRCVTRGATLRKESRGGHTREDYPKPDPEFAKFNFAHSTKGGNWDSPFDTVESPLLEMPADLKALLEEDH